MPKVSAISRSPPYAVEEALKRLGQNIKTARLRRKFSREELASKIGISRYVLADIESGKPTTAIAAYLGTLWAMDLLEPIRTVADPDLDEIGKTLERARAPGTAPKRSKELNNEF